MAFQLAEETHVNALEQVNQTHLMSKMSVECTSESRNATMRILGKKMKLASICRMFAVASSHDSTECDGAP
jgi:hypothetical protein